MDVLVQTIPFCYQAIIQSRLTCIVRVVNITLTDVHVHVLLQHITCKTKQKVHVHLTNLISLKSTVDKAM